MFMVASGGKPARLPEPAFVVQIGTTLHHYKSPSNHGLQQLNLIEQELAITEFYRVLKQGGLLLFAESMRVYIHSWVIRRLFRHPMDVQKSADEYLALIRRTGFKVEPDRISFPYLWWSRPDLGLLNKLGIRRTPPQGQREETLMNLVAVKPNC